MIFKRIAKIFVGCLLILIILVILGAVFAGTIAKRVISGFISQKTGANVSISDINKGSFTYTDPKSGATYNIGANKLPGNFPKDFPIYPGSTVATSSSSNSSTNAVWVALATSDGIDKVSSYYQTNLTAYGWTNTKTQGSTNGWTVSKGSLDGSLTIEAINGQTLIQIVLGQEK